MMSEQPLEALQSGACSFGSVGFGLDQDPPILPKRKDGKARIGLLVPFSGTDAIWGPSCQYGAVLAAAHVNASGGLLGREIELFAADAGGAPADVMPRVADLVDRHQVDALVGVHLSSVRVAVRDWFSARVPYVFAPQYEGGESSAGVATIGETPKEQYGDAVSWMIRHMRAKRWHLLGNDYVWPRQTHKVLKKMIKDAGGEVVGENYLPLSCDEHTTTIDAINKARPDIVFQSLVGADSITFNRMFAEAGLSDRIIRLSGAIEENTLMGISEDAAQNLYCVSGYFNSLRTEGNRSFLHEYRQAFGDTAPIQGSLSQSCYESILALRSLAEKAQSLKPPAINLRHSRQP
ncbi:substrate-binding domain-containing protein [Ruegeria sp. HKCCD8929]|uniref:substrate-binding domain-containing protein n=1 Tax=Ruegeria sp. HKCCD8929 TaxID=2683006 RepID=UPI001488F3CB|nr:substrate-binding domain-containing protein [Ruegeria sp. HKCCD8929]